MLRLSKMADYAMVVLAALAENNGGLSCAQIALNTRLSEPTVAKVLKLLTRKSILQSTRGTMGGYTINGALHDISVLSIVEAIDGPVIFADCVENGPGCSFETMCTVKGRWDPVADAIKDTLAHLTLADMLTRLPIARSA